MRHSALRIQHYHWIKRSSHRYREQPRGYQEFLSSSQVKDLVLLLQWLWLLLCRRFHPWPENFSLQSVWPEKGEKKNHLTCDVIVHPHLWKKLHYFFFSLIKRKRERGESLIMIEMGSVNNFDFYWFGFRSF